MRYSLRSRLIATAILALTACQLERPSVREESAAIPAAPADQATLASDADTSVASVAVSQAALDSARQSLRGFLHGSLEVTRPSTHERYYACSPDGQNNRSLALVGYRLLDAVPASAETILASAEVSGVAVESDSGPGDKEWNVYVGLRRDTMTWRMMRDSATGRWGVCGYSTRGWGFGHWGGDANSTFFPADMNWARIHALADSITPALGDTL